MSATFDEGTWVWAPDEEEIFLPARVQASFKRGEPGNTELPDGEVIPISAADSAELKVCDEQCLVPIENMVMLNDLNNASLLHNLRIRFKKNTIYTNVGAILVAVNPFKLLPIYTPEWIDKYKASGSRGQPPHVYGLADDAYRSMMQESANHSIVISGESGAGKTETMKLALQYIAEVSGKRVGGGAGNDDDTTASLEERILKANPVMEAFGNAKTTRNNTSSRFGKWTEIKFDNNGAIIGGAIINYLLEKSRVVFQGDQERNYHIFYQLMAGAEASSSETDPLKNYMSRYKLKHSSEFHYLNQSGVTTVDGINDFRDWTELLNAMDIIEMSADDVHNVMSLVAGVLHLGNTEYVLDAAATEEDKVTIKDEANHAVVAEMLSVDAADLKQALTCRGIGTQSVIYVSYTAEQAQEARDALAKSLYGKLFDYLVTVVNATLSRGLDESSVATMIGVLDIFGFESFEHNSFEQLCINFCNEKLQFHFNEHIFKLEQEQYRAEGINVDNIEFEDNQAALDLIEKKKNPSGIIPRIDEEIRTPKGSDAGFLSKLIKEFGQRKKEHKNFALPKRKAKNADQCFIVKHYAGPVCYNVTGFLEKSKDTLHVDIQSVMRTSTSPLIGPFYKSSAAEAETKTSSRRRGRGRGGGSSKKTLGTQFKEQLNDLMVRLNKTHPHFVRCFKPNSEKQGDIFTAQMMLEQLNYAGLLEVCRIRQIGYPVRRDFDFFLSRYRCLFPAADDCDQLIQGLAKEGIVDPGDCVKGKTKVFLRNKQAQELEGRREDALTLVAVRIQRVARGFVVRLQARRWREILAGLADATSTQNVEKLEHWLRHQSELPFSGVHLPAVKEAARLNERLKEEYRINELLENAIKSRELNGLVTAIKAAEAMGNFISGTQTIEKAKGLVDRIREEKQCREELGAAVTRRVRAELEQLCDKAESLGLQESAEYNQACAVLERIAEEEEAAGLLQAAVDAADLNALVARLDRMGEMGLDDSSRFPQFAAIIGSAKELRSQLKGKRDATRMLQKAIADRNMAALREAVARATEVGVPASEVAAAEELIAQIEKQNAAREALRAAVGGGDKAEIAAALGAAQGLDISGDVIGDAQAALKRLEAQEAAQAALQSAISGKNASELSSALQQARDCGLASDLVGQAETLLASMGAQSAMIAKLGSASNDLAALEAAIQEAEGMGGMEEALEQARANRKKLFAQGAALEKCEEAIASQSFEGLKAAMSEARSCGLDTNPMSADKWSEIQAALNDLEEVARAQELLNSAVAAHSKEQILQAIERAEEIGAMDSGPGQAARAMLDQIAREEALTAEIAKALEATDKETLSTLYAEAQGLSLDNEQVRSAGMIVNREKTIQQVFADFQKAEQEGDLDLMNKAMQTCIELGIEGDEVEAAKKTLAAMKAEAEQASKMNAVANAIAVKAKSAEGIADADLEPLVAAMDACRAEGLAEDSIAMTRMNKRLERFRKQIALKATLSETLEYCDQPGEDTIFQQYKRVGQVLEQALDLEMETADVAALKTIHRDMDRQVQAARQARNEADDDEDESEDEDEEDEDEEEAARQREALIERCSQPRFHYSKFSRIRTAEDWVKGGWFGKKKAMATQMVWQGSVIKKSMLDNNASAFKKAACRIHKCILGYCGDKTMNFPEMLAKDVLTKGVQEMDLRDELYVQICKQLTENPKQESQARCWQLLSMAVGTFPPSAQFKDHLINFIATYRNEPGLVGSYANYSLNRLLSILSTGASGFIPNVAEIEAYKQRPPILATIEHVDGDPFTDRLPITPDLNVAKVLEICYHFIGISDDRSKYWGLFVVDVDAPVHPKPNGGSKGGNAPPPPPPAEWDLPKSPAPLRDQDFMGDIYVNRRRQGKEFKFVFKRKIYLKDVQLPELEDEEQVALFDRLTFLQATDEVITGNVPMTTEEDLIDFVSKTLFVEHEYVPESNEDILEEQGLMEFMPVPWKRDHTPDEWASAVRTRMMKLDGQDEDEIMYELLEKVGSHELYGTQFFHVKRVPYDPDVEEPRPVRGLPDLMLCAFNSDGMHFLNSSMGKSYRILRSFGYSDIYRWGGSHTRFSLIIYDADSASTFEFSLYTSQATDMAGLILDYIEAIMEVTPVDE